MIFFFIINRNSTNSRIICANTYILDKSINLDDRLGFSFKSWISSLYSVHQLRDQYDWGWEFSTEDGRVGEKNKSGAGVVLGEMGGKEKL